MEQSVKRAVDYMRGAYSCSQSVMCAFCEEAGISHDEAKIVAAPYAGGAKVKCGAVWGALLILEKKFGKEAAAEKQTELENKFREKVSSINCREIRGKRLRPCIGCVEDAASILEGILHENGSERG